ncbi:hypothetical protein NS183_05730 [Microbacterium testaceum]|nr:hypothetical protein NS183_05730 [Microbacterium testaceum]
MPQEYSDVADGRRVHLIESIQRDKRLWIFEQSARLFSTRSVPVEMDPQPSTGHGEQHLSRCGGRGWWTGLEHLNGEVGQAHERRGMLV